jgi:hypothetical protein
VRYFQPVLSNHGPGIKRADNVVRRAQVARQGMMPETRDAADDGHGPVGAR